MIEAIEKLDNVGPLKKAVPSSPVRFDKATLIYAENAHGKTTLADVLRAFSAKDDQAVKCRQHWHGSQPPLVKITVQGSPRVFGNGAWRHDGPGILVFDAQFVEDNVYSGQRVSPEHRAGLHRFALGEAAVQLQEEYDDAVLAEQDTQQERDLAESALAKCFPGLTADRALLIPRIANVDALIAAAEKQKSDALNLDQILRRPEPQMVDWSPPDLADLWALLSRTVAQVAESAEIKVQEHLKLLEPNEAEAWIEEGVGFIRDDLCPFCGQGVGGRELIAAYRAYFDAEYAQLKTDAVKSVREVAAQLPDTAATLVGAIAEGNAKGAQQWQGDVDLELPNLDSLAFGMDVKAVRETLTGLAQRKIGTPLDVIGAPDERAAVDSKLDALSKTAESYNAAVEQSRQRVNAYKKDLQAADFQAIDAELTRLNRAKLRHKAKTKALVKEYKSKRAAHQAAESAKDGKRKALDVQMEVTLKDLGTETNRVLDKFGAPFRLNECRSTSVVGVKRVEYALDFSGVCVEVVGEKAGIPGRDFGTALSEGDKRTLAVAFFLAKATKDPKLAETILVLDDPICSMGQQRRQATIEEIEALVDASVQTIVLSHEPYFLQSLQERLTRRARAKVAVAVLALRPAAGTGLELTGFDLARHCQSDYRRRFRRIRGFVASGGAGNHLCVAEDLRVVLEGYLKRKFVGWLDACGTVGEMIGVLKAFKPPITFLDGACEKELTDLNEYAWRFHHDGSANWSMPTPPPLEVLQYAKRLLRLVEA